MYEIKWLSFSDRKKLADIFESWTEEIENATSFKVARSTEAVITFLQVQGLLNPEQAKQFIREYLNEKE